MDTIVQECIVPLTFLCLGGLFCFKGEKLHKALLNFMGFICGAGPVAYVGWAEFRDDFWIWVPAALVVGALMCFFLVKVYSAAIFTLGALGGLTLCPVIFNFFEISEGWQKALIACVISLVCGFMAGKLSDIAIKIFTALLGASLIVYAFNLVLYTFGELSEGDLMLEGGTYTNGSFIAIAILAISGFICQKKS